jgi:hypothetical protein
MIDPRAEEGDHEVSTPVELVSILVRRDEAEYLGAGERCVCGHLMSLHEQMDELHCLICDWIHW